MKWSIPAKTFLLGEYAALEGERAIILTSEPCFELELIQESSLQCIHSESPAGRFWLAQQHEQGLKFYDPYEGKGGFGASSAQFLGAYKADCFLQNKEPDLDELLKIYEQYSWSGKGKRPSGYDLIAQAHQGLVYIHKNKGMIKTYSWPFKNLKYFITHTGVKYATHEHLQEAQLNYDAVRLSAIVAQAHAAITKVDAAAFVVAINAYALALEEYHLVAPHTQNLIAQLKQNRSNVLAVKGCGAMGADVVLGLES